MPLTPRQQHRRSLSQAVNLIRKSILYIGRVAQAFAEWERDEGVALGVAMTALEQAARTVERIHDEM